MSTAAEPSSEGIDNLRKNYDELKSQFSDLQGKYRELQASTAFKEVGLNEKHAQLFLRVHDEGEDITAKAVKDFAKEYDLAPQANPEGGEQQPPEPSNQPEGQVQQPNPQDSALQSMGGAGTQGTGENPPSSPGQKLSQAEFQKLLQTDRAAALQAYTEGRVQTVEGNVFVDQAKRAGTIE